MITDFTRELIEDFVIEDREHFDAIEANLIELEKNPTDAAALQNVFRAFHTIKGNAALLKYQSITSLSHKAENMLAKIRDEGRPADSETIDLILKITDVLKSMIDGVERGESIDFDLSAIFQRIDQAVNKTKQEISSPSRPEVRVAPRQEEIRMERPAASAYGKETQERKVSVGKVHLSTRKQDDFYIISAAGSLDLQGSDILLKELIKILDSGGHKIALSLEKASFLSCCGLGALYATHQTLQEEHGALKISGIPQNARKIIKITGLSSELETFDSVEEAVGSL
ncbi:MAG: anti-sigma factor antagonist [Nitrospinae bacterium]|nr:anti-sigma factor antagonist [Nitrospinota bacterium]